MIEYEILEYGKGFIFKVLKCDPLLIPLMVDIGLITHSECNFSVIGYKCENLKLSDAIKIVEGKLRKIRSYVFNFDYDFIYVNGEASLEILNMSKDLMGSSYIANNGILIGSVNTMDLRTDGYIYLCGKDDFGSHYRCSRRRMNRKKFEECGEALKEFKEYLNKKKDEIIKRREA